MRSDVIKSGVERAPHRSLLRALGCTGWEMDQPFVGVVNSYSEVIPGHAHLRLIADAVKAGNLRRDPLSRVARSGRLGQADRPQPQHRLAAAEDAGQDA